MSRRACWLTIGVLAWGAVASGPRPAIVSAQAQAGRQAAAPVAADTIRIGVLKNGTYDVVSMPMETYIARVLAGEAAPDSAPAALEALAIAIRTYTITNRTRHAAEGFDLCDQTHCQVMRNATSATERAAQASAEQILTYRGEPATVFYSASCGGRSERPSNVWPGVADQPYLTVHDDDACGGFPMWSAELAGIDLQRAFAAGGYRGTLRDIRVLSRDDSGRVAQLALDGLTPREISGQDLRMVVGRTLGFQHVQSAAFELRRSGSAYRFTGRGSGHGVGLCVIGSMKLAAAGQSAPAILARYFPGTQIQAYAPRASSPPPETPPPPAPPRETRAAPVAPPPRVLPPAAAPLPPAAGAAEDPLSTRQAPPQPAGGDVTVIVPGADPAERAALASLVSRERQTVAQTLGVEAPRVTVRAHDSNDAYERATGQPWFTMGSVVRGEIQLTPLRVLRERGMLERTIRRQLVHVMADTVLPERPAWIREGAAVHFADPDAPDTARPPCPTDAEIQRPLSIGALGDAWGRARACFIRQISGGRDWRRVR